MKWPVEQVKVVQQYKCVGGAENSYAVVFEP